MRSLTHREQDDADLPRVSAYHDADADNIVVTWSTRQMDDGQTFDNRIEAAEFVVSLLFGGAPLCDRCHGAEPREGSAWCEDCQDSDCTGCGRPVPRDALNVDLMCAVCAP